MTESRKLLQHFLAALAYRTQKALRDAPVGFGDLRVSPTSRTPHEIVWHMTGVIGYARTTLTGGKWKPDRQDDLDAEIRRFHGVLEELAHDLDVSDGLDPEILSRLLQGPMADAMTHVGQLAYLRRLAGSPVPPENFMLADVDSSRLGLEQPLPRAQCRRARSTGRACLR